MNKKQLKAFSLLRVMLNGEDLTISDVFVTGDAIACWGAENEAVIDLTGWHWHKGSDSNADLYIVTGRKTLS